MSRKPEYPFAAPNATTSGNPPQQQGGFTQPRRPASLQHSPMNQQTQRRPFIAPTTPSASPNNSSASLLLPNQRGPPAGSPVRPGANLTVPSARGQPSLKTKNSDASLAMTASLGSSISDKYSFGADPASWGAEIGPGHPEPDDHIHNPDPRRDRKNDEGGTIFTSRGIANLGCLAILACGLVTLFAGYPIITYFSTHPITTIGALNLGGINKSGQVPSMTGNFALIDKDTPESEYTITSFQDGSELTLVFSDEFNTDGRSFYPGDDPYWEAVDLYYWPTLDLEWYDPSQITTTGGNLVITLEQETNHNVSFKSGMLQSWNKFCFTDGLILARAQIAGSSSIQGMWPAIWTMGNLGRAGFGATTDGMWPYSYDSCDVGTLPNQTNPDGTPLAASNTGSKGGELSYLPGQRLSACTCPGEVDHPGPIKSDGTFKGRSAPEIDVIETQVTGDGVGHVSQSAQYAPFNANYLWDNTSANAILHQDSFVLNSYHGGITQMTTSALGLTNQSCYEFSGGCFDTYGFEYKSGTDGWITWISSGAASWTAMAAGMAADPVAEVSQRPVPEEPLYLIINLGMSNGFDHVDMERLTFPAHLSIDWIRIYQPKDSINVGCDPPDFPTAAYIDKFPEPYTNANLTTWKQYGQSFPKNKLVDTC
ncbi:hypothetical protein FRB95_014397 [Tulasnella sp. JGI-2019a]|nr:hypothetical protein FRB95_014397 [Tulasnella sp. JGI-2019a]